MLRKLGAMGFSHVVATPHMRPGMFDNVAADLRAAYSRATASLKSADALPATSLGSEHYFSAEVVAAIYSGRGLPYLPSADVSDEEQRQGGAILVEFNDLTALPIVEHQLFQLQTAGYIPVIAHPERYRAVWENPEIVARLVSLGSVALLDTAALVGKYGRRAQETAELLLHNGDYDAACSDAHRPADVDLVAKAVDLIARKYGPEEVELLLKRGPDALLAGLRPTID